MSVVHAATREEGAVISVYMVLFRLKTVLISMAYVIKEGHVELSGLWCSQKPRRSLWSMLLLAVKDKEATFAATRLTADSQLKKRGRGNIVQLLFVEFKIYTNQTSTNND